MKITIERYEDLLGRLLDGHLSEPESAELSRAVAADEDLLRDLREHLVLWELWSQEQTAGRDTDAFLRGFQTRLAAEADTDSFAAAAVLRIAAETPSRRLQFWPVAIAASLLVAALLGMWLAQPNKPAPVANEPVNTVPVLPLEASPPPEDAALIQVRGELVCAKCALQRSESHEAAIRRNDATGDNILFISSETAQGELHGETFCAKPASVFAEGRIRKINERPELLATRVEIRR